MIPDEEEALELHEKIGSSKKIVDHCLAVARIASALVSCFQKEGIAVDGKSVFAAALLHDIGRNRVQTVKHGFVGAEIVRENGVDESVARIIERHVGAGLDREDAEKNGLPIDRDYIPRTLEERIVCFSDKLAGPDGELVPLEREIEKYKKKSLDYTKLLALKKSLGDDLGRDPEAAIREELANKERSAV